MGQWLRKAGEDLELARLAFSQAKPVAWAAAFHAQQCAEKAIKAYLVHRQIEFPFTHDLVTLIELCGSPLKDDARVHAAAALTTFAVSSRYPGFEPDAAAARGAIELANGLLTAVRHQLVQEGAKID